MATSNLKSDGWIAEMRRRRREGDYHLLTELFANPLIANEQLGEIRHLITTFEITKGDFLQIQQQFPTVKNLADHVRPSLDQYFRNQNGRVGKYEIETAIAEIRKTFSVVVIGDTMAGTYGRIVTDLKETMSPP